jgi:hypothetical protein
MLSCLDGPFCCRHLINVPPHQFLSLAAAILQRLIYTRPTSTKDGTVRQLSKAINLGGDKDRICEFKHCVISAAVVLIGGLTKGFKFVNLHRRHL